VLRGLSRFRHLKVELLTGKKQRDEPSVEEGFTSRAARIA
jgi:hypothetical protein